jgi:hypothetical protein
MSSVYSVFKSGASVGAASAVVVNHALVIALLQGAGVRANRPTQGDALD